MQITVNGEIRRIVSEPDTPLLWVLRDELGLTGTKFGCGIASCGACTVHVDGRAVRACVLPVERVTGAVTTIEGLARRESLAGSGDAAEASRATPDIGRPRSSVDDAPADAGVASGSTATLHPLQQAWIEHQVAQCGYCQSGQIMTAAALLAADAAPSDAAIERAMAGNLCRCGTYPRIRAAIRSAAEAVAGTSEEGKATPPLGKG